MSWFVLSFIVLGSVYLLTSVGVSIYRQRHVLPTGNKVGTPLTDAEIAGCFQELDDVRRRLGKLLESFPHLLAGYEPEPEDVKGIAVGASENLPPMPPQQWAEEGNSWKAQWKKLGQRCRFGELPAIRLRKELEQMAAVHVELGETYDLYTSAFKSFGTKLAPRMIRIGQRMKKIDESLKKSAASQPGENTP